MVKPEVLSATDFAFTMMVVKQMLVGVQVTVGSSQQLEIDCEAKPVKVALEQLLPLSVAIKQSRLESLVNATLATEELELLKDRAVLIAAVVLELVVLQCVPFGE